MTLSPRLGRTLHVALWPLLWIYLRRSARTRVLVKNAGQILLVKSWLSDGTWGLPGGGLQSKEAAVHGACRELHEETGLRCDPELMKLMASEWRERRGLKFYCHYFAVELSGQKVLRPQPIEILEAKWVKIKELDGMPVKPEVWRALELSNKN